MTVFILAPKGILYYREELVMPDPKRKRFLLLQKRHRQKKRGRVVSFMRNTAVFRVAPAPEPPKVFAEDVFKLWHLGELSEDLSRTLFSAGLQTVGDVVAWMRSASPKKIRGVGVAKKSNISAALMRAGVCV